MNEKKLDKLIHKAAHIPIPEGLEKRLENQIDLYAAAEKKKSFRPYYIWSASAAAGVLLGIGIFISTVYNANNQKIADTYSDPREASLVAEKALTFMSVQLNAGLEQLTDAGQEMEKINNILNKHFNDQQHEN